MYSIRVIFINSISLIIVNGNKLLKKQLLLICFLIKWSRKGVNDLFLMYSYGIFKRTQRLPLFHPYFIDYGGNKEFFYLMLNTMGSYREINLMNRISIFLISFRFCY